MISDLIISILLGSVLFGIISRLYPSSLRKAKGVSFLLAFLLGMIAYSQTGSVAVAFGVALVFLPLIPRDSKKRTETDVKERTRRK